MPQPPNARVLVSVSLFVGANRLNDADCRAVRVSISLNGDVVVVTPAAIGIDVFATLLCKVVLSARQETDAAHWLINPSALCVAVTVEDTFLFVLLLDLRRSLSGSLAHDL